MNLPVGVDSDPNVLPYFFEWQVSLDGRWTFDYWDHIDHIEEWKVGKHGPAAYVRTLLEVKRPYFNHVGYNNLTWDPDFDTLTLGLGDGGSEYDPLNIAQDDNILSGKFIVIKLDKLHGANLTNAVATFSELQAAYPAYAKAFVPLIKGLRNPNSLTFEKVCKGGKNEYIKYLSNTGQDTIEWAHAFIEYGWNFGFRAWEGNFINSQEVGEGARTIPTQFAQEAILLPNFYRPFAQFGHTFAEPTVNASAQTSSAFFKGDIEGMKGKLVMINWFDEASHPGHGTMLVAKADKKDLQRGVAVDFVNIQLPELPLYFTALATDSKQEKLYLGTQNSVQFVYYIDPVTHQKVLVQSTPDQLVLTLGNVFRVVEQ